MENKIKRKANNLEISILGYQLGFISEIEQTKRFFGIDAYNVSLNGENLFSRGIFFNALLLSTQYVSLLKNSKYFFDDKKIIEEGLVQEIPVLFSQIYLPDMGNFGICELEYLKEYFNEIYVLRTIRTCYGDPTEISTTTSNKTKRIYSNPNENPINNWITQTKKTDLIKIN